MTDSKKDQELIKQFQQGNQKTRETAFAELYRRHEKSLRWYLTRMTKNRKQAEDIAQEAFLKALKALDEYTPEASFKTWLFQIATNTLRNKKKKKRPASGLSEKQRTPSAETDAPDASAQRRESQQEVLDAVDQLSDKLRAAVVLVQFEGMKYKQAARTLGVSMSALKARMSRAYQQLRTELLEN